MYPDPNRFQSAFPTETFLDPTGQFQHGQYVGEASVLNVLCGEKEPAKSSLADPPFGTPLFNQIRDFLNAL